MLTTIIKELGLVVLVTTSTACIMASPIVARVITNHLHPADALNTLPPTYGNYHLSCNKHL